MERRRTLASVTIFLMLFATADSKLRRKSQVTGGLCDHIIEPAGYPCSEHSTKTKDGYLLGLQRVSSRSTIVSGEMGPPVLLIHGLFMGVPHWLRKTVVASSCGLGQSSSQELAFGVKL